MKQLFTTLLMGSMALGSALGQGVTMSLEECMAYGVENGISVQSSKLNSLNSQEDKTQATASLFPSLSADVGLNNSWGRSIDPETNTYGTASNLSNSYSISAYLTLFDGLSNINTLRASKVKVEGGEFELQNARDKKQLDVMQLYFDVLYYTQSVELTEEQLEAAEAVLELTKSQYDLGLKSDADVALAAAEVASYDLLKTQQQSTLAQSDLNLKEAMNFPFDTILHLVPQSISGEWHNAENFDIEGNIEVRIARNSVKESELNLKVAKGRYLPSLGVGAGYGTNYFKNFGSGLSTMSFGEQLKTNYGYYVGASLSIPIFSNLSIRTSVNKHKNYLKQAKLNAKETELRIEKAAKESLTRCESSYKEYLSATRKTEANTIAYKAMSAKYSKGMVSIIDLQKTSTELLIAKAAKLRAELNYLKEGIMVNYYINGKINN